MDQRKMISGGFYLFLSLMILLLPLKWVIAMILAAVFHELCHYVAIRLLTGQDIAEQLSVPDTKLGEMLCLSRITLRSEGDLFLCGMSPAQLEEKLGVPVAFTDTDGASFLCTLLGIE